MATKHIFQTEYEDNLNLSIKEYRIKFLILDKGEFNFKKNLSLSQEDTKTGAKFYKILP